MPEWKVIPQRNFLKGLQATFGLFSQPGAILTRLSNLLYDRRGSLRTTDGSAVFTQRNGAAQIADGPITELALYSPPAANAYLVGIKRNYQRHIGVPATLQLTLAAVGGPIYELTRSNGQVTLYTNGPHNVAALAVLRSAPFNPGFLVVSGVLADPSFNAAIPFNTITVTSANTIVYPQAGPDSDVVNAGAAQNWQLGTQLAPGTYSYDVTACDGLGGETPATGLPQTVTVDAAHNVVLLNWVAGTNDAEYSAYGTAAARLGRLNPGPGPQQTIIGPAFADIGLLSVAGAAPPATNSTQACSVYRMDAPSYSVELATLPPYILPLMGGLPGATAGGGSGNAVAYAYYQQQSALTAESYTSGQVVTYAPPGPTDGGSSGTGGTSGSGSGTGGATADPSAGAGPTAVGGVPGSISPLPQMAQFAGRLVFALGNGFPPQQYTDPSIDGTGFAAIGNTFTSAYPDWQGSVAWNQDDQIRDSVSGGIFQATQGGVSAAARPLFVNQLGRITADASVAWKCIATNYQGTALRGAAHAVVYAGALWLFNTWPTTTSDSLDGPNCVKMSDVNNPGSWNPVNVAFIAKDDGDQIMGAATFTIAESGISPTGSLVVFKNFSTYQISGVFGAADFAIQQAQTDMGCIAPRSIQFAPGYGIMRMTHLGIAYFNGVSDKVVSEEIRPYLFGGADDIAPVDWNYIYFAKSAQSANPPMYLMAAPVLAANVPGVTLAPGTAPSAGASFALYARVAQLSQAEDGSWQENAITAEQQLVSGDLSITATTPAAAPGIKYRLYAGVTAGGENLYAEAASFASANVTLASMIAGAPSLANGSLTRLFCYDLIQRVWAILDLPFPISALRQLRAPGAIPLTVAGGYGDGQLRRLFAGDVLWDTGEPIAWSFRSAELYQNGGSSKVFFRKLVLRGSETLGASITVSLKLNGVQGGDVRADQLNLGTDQWQFQVDILKDALNANAEVSGAGQITVDALDWYVKPKAQGAPVTIQK